MATFNKFQHFVEALANKEIDMFGATSTWKAVLHSDAPDLAVDDELADLTQVTGTGYTAGGQDIANDATRSGGTVTVTAATDVTWTAGAGDWGAFRYVAIHDEDSITDILVCDYDYGTNVTPANGETFTIDFGAALATLA